MSLPIVVVVVGDLVLPLVNRCVVVDVVSLSLLDVAEENVELDAGTLVLVDTVVVVSVDTVVGSTVLFLGVVCSVQIHSEIKYQETLYRNLIAPRSNRSVIRIMFVFEKASLAKRAREKGLNSLGKNNCIMLNFEHV